MLCAHSVWHASGKGKGQRAGNAIESWLSHSETCILMFEQLMGRSAQRFSIEDEGCMSGGELATGGPT